MKRPLLLCISFIAALTAPLLHTAKAAESPGQGVARQEILILNSYHPGYAFSDDEQAGVIDVFRAKDKNWVPVIEYLDMKRLPDGRHLAELKKLFRLKYQNKKFSVVIAMDNPALEFAIDNQAELFGNAPIVFCGINNYTPSLLKGRTNVTGIVEAIDIAGTIEMMLRLHPAAREIFNPHDYTATGLAVRKELQALVPRFGPKVRFRFTDPLTMEELLKELEQLPKESLVLEIGFITDKSGRTFGISETTKLFSEHSPVPIYSTYEQRLGFGIVGGKLLSPRIHGANGARIALRVLAGEKVSTIPIVYESDSQFMFDHKVMSRFGIPLSALPEGSTVINKPVSFYAAHRAVILTALGIISFLSVIIVLLIINTIQRRRSLEVIRRSEELFKAITSNNPDHLIVQDNDLRYSFVMNPQLSLTQRDMIGKTDYDFLSKEDADELTEIKREVLKTGRPVHVEVPLTSAAGGQEFFDGSYIPRFDAKGQVDGLVGYFRNVTERKQAEEDVSLHVERTQALLDLHLMAAESQQSILDFVLEAAQKACRSQFSFIGLMDKTESFMTIHTWSKDTMAQCASVDKPIHFPISEAGVWGDCVRQRKPVTINDYEVPWPSKKGYPEGHVPIRRFLSVPIFDGIKIVAVAAVANKKDPYTEDDVHALISLVNKMWEILWRKQEDEKLLEKEEKYRNLFNNAEVGIFRSRLDGSEVLEVNKRFLEIVGMTMEETLGKPSVNLWADPQEREEMVKILVANGSVSAFEYRMLNKRQGDVRNCLTSLRLYREQGMLEGTILDITDRKRAEEALRNSEEKFRLAMDATNDSLWDWNMATNEVYRNPRHAVMLGYEPQDFSSSQDEWESLIHPDDKQKVFDCLRAHIKRETLFFVLEYRLKTKSGDYLWVLGRGKVVAYDNAGTPIRMIGTNVDIAERKKAEAERQSLEERLQRSEKMEALGTLAGGVAHDLNNVLGIVVGYAEMTLDDVDKSSPLRPGLVNIMNGGLRAAAIVDDLLTLARRGVQGRNILNLNKIITDCQKSPEFANLSFQHPSVKIKTDLEPDLLNISGSSVHLGKTLYNLISNASEAMAKGGTVTITTSNQYLSRPIQGYDQIRAGDYVVLSVSDTGEGIHEADLKRIFEPFYTKKVMGRSGTGLGLSVVWGTVKDHNGYINVESEKGKGSTFTLYFPVTREEIAVDAAAVAISEYTGNSESILVVDDVKEQRDLAAGMLKTLNYNVSSVSSGEAAVAYLKEHQVDLMVLDMIMDPGMDGLDTYKKVLEIHPKQKAIIVSGFSESDRVKTAEGLGAGAYVRKPYIKEKLGIAVRKELDRSA